MLLQLALAGIVGLAAGLAIGCIGVGGVIIVPALVAGGVPIHAALAAALAGFILTGVVGTAVFARRGTLDARSAMPTLLASMPTAVAGALAAQAASATLLELAIGALTIVSGLNILWRARDRQRSVREAPLRTSLGIAVGAVTGFLSALTGTGGPAILLPILLGLDVSVLVAVGLSQAIQLPIASLATLGNVWGAPIHWDVALPLGIGLALGTWVGARLAHALHQGMLRQLVALMLLAVGLSMLVRVALRVA